MLLSQLESSGALRDSAVAEAFRSVLRHHFLPGRPLEEIYEDAAIMTKLGAEGIPISSSSQPAIMAVMLQQLRLQPGNRVLEIGAGTGYNAALIARLIGPTGRLLTVDIDEDLCVQARANLAAAGIEGVEVVQADGADGWPAAAPYDRMILTVSTTDLAPAWHQQLVEGGLLVVPVALAGPVQLSVAFMRRGAALFSTEVTCCGFMPLRGQMAPAAAPAVPSPEPWLEQAGRQFGYSLPAGDLWAGFESWLALTHNDYVRRERGFGLGSQHGAALVLGEGEERVVGVFGEGNAAAEALAAEHRDWARTRPLADRLVVEAHPSSMEIPEDGPARILPRPHFTFVVRKRS